VEFTLRWALSAPEPERTFSYTFRDLDALSGDYFVGRQHLTAGEAGRLIVETECCLLARQTEPLVHNRFKVTLDWDLDARQGAWTLRRDFEAAGRQWHLLPEGPQSALAALELRRVGPSTLEDVRAAHRSDVSSALHTRLADRWETLLVWLQECAVEALENEGSEGELPFDAFPSFLELTGEYQIDRLSDLTEKRGHTAFFIDLQFKGRQNRPDQEEFGYLGLDFEVTLDDQGEFVLEYFNSSVGWWKDLQVPTT